MSASALDRVRILVVEDNYMVAANLADGLAYAGASVVGIMGNLEDGLAFVESRHAEVDIALLDVNLAGVMSYPIADLLVKHRVPFIFTTGYDNASMEAAYRGFPVCMKPFSFDTVVLDIRRRLGSVGEPE